MPQNYLVIGDWNADCDRCGFKFKASMLQKDWQGLRVCKNCFETRHPQDFLRVRIDDPSVPWARPEGQDQFTPGGFCTVEGLSAIPGYAMPGCMIPARTFTGL